MYGTFPDDELVEGSLPDEIGDYYVTRTDDSYHLVSEQGQLIITPREVVINDYYALHQERWELALPVTIIDNTGIKTIMVYWIDIRCNIND